MKPLSFIILWLCLPILVTAQQTSKEELNELLSQMELVDTYSDQKLQESADEVFSELRYSKSSKLLKKMIQNGEFTISTAEEMAHSHRLNNETEEAEFWYAQVVGKSKNDLTYYHYAKMLLANGKCEDAVTWYREYQKRERQGRNLGFFESCDEMKNFYEPEYPISISHPDELNSKQLDFFAYPKNQDDIVFTSNRKRGGFFINVDDWTGETFNAIYVAEFDKEKGTYKRPKALKGDFQSDIHCGTPTFVDEKHMIFTMNNENDRTSQGNKPLHLFYANKTDKERWGNFKPLEINKKNYSSCHPALNLEKNKLYFSSNRPGGYGGMDIYVSEKVNDKWQEPINLGPGVNTAGNEFFPFVHPDGILFFSSDGHKGFGGYDIFAVRKVVKDVETFWSNRVNLGKPYNSSDDELGFTISKDQEFGFYTSNRNNGRGEDDIYKWKAEKPLNIFERFVDKIFVIKDQNGNLIKNARVLIKLKEEETNELRNLEDETNANAELSVRVKPFSKYEVTILKEGLEPIVFDVEPLDEWTSLPEVINIKAEEIATSFQFELVSNEGEIIKENVALKSIRTEKSIPLTFDKGRFTSTVNVNEHYQITYTDQKAAVHTFNVEGSKEMRSPDKLYSYEVVVETGDRITENLENTSPLSNSGDGSISPTNAENKSISGSESTTHTNVNTSSTVFTSSQETIIFYDFDKYVVGNKYTEQLDEIASVLNADASLMAEIISNTDSRGNAAYNKKLAARRSESIKAYLRRKKVDLSRVSIRNLGEESLPVDCQGNCTEDIHRLNRRSTIRIINK